MVFKESVGESIRLGDEVVSIDGVPVDGKLATDCEAAVKKSTHCFSFWNCIARYILENHYVAWRLNTANP